MAWQAMGRRFLIFLNLRVSFYRHVTKGSNQPPARGKKKRTKTPPAMNCNTVVHLLFINNNFSLFIQVTKVPLMAISLPRHVKPGSSSLPFTLLVPYNVITGVAGIEARTLSPPCTCTSTTPCPKYGHPSLSALDRVQLYPCHAMPSPL